MTRIPQKPVPPADADRDSIHLHPDSPESREDCVRKSLILRLRNVCSHLTATDFEALVMKMTREQLRSEGARWRKDDPDPC